MGPICYSLRYVSAVFQQTVLLSLGFQQVPAPEPVRFGIHRALKRISVLCR